MGVQVAVLAEYALFVETKAELRQAMKNRRFCIKIVSFLVFFG